MTYGKIRFAASDRSFICEVLNRRGAALLVRGQDAMLPDNERQYYRTVAAEYAALEVKLVRHRGKVPFSEEELKTLKDTLASSERTEAMQEWSRARSAGDTTLEASLSKKIDHLEALLDLMNKPFVNDPSQDGSGEDDVSEDSDDEENDGTRGGNS